MSVIVVLGLGSWVVAGDSGLSTYFSFNGTPHTSVTVILVIERPCSRQLSSPQRLEAHFLLPVPPSWDGTRVVLVATMVFWI